jgi:hypothetical protein
MSEVLIETTLELWISSLREVNDRSLRNYALTEEEFRLSQGMDRSQTEQSTCVLFRTLNG